MYAMRSSGAVKDPYCIGSRGASFGTPCYYTCVTLTRKVRLGWSNLARVNNPADHPLLKGLARSGMQPPPAATSEG